MLKIHEYKIKEGMPPNHAIMLKEAHKRKARSSVDRKPKGKAKVAKKNRQEDDGLFPLQ